MIDEQEDVSEGQISQKQGWDRVANNSVIAVMW